MSCKGCKINKEMPRLRAIRHTEKIKFLEMAEIVAADKEMGPREKKVRLEQIMFHTLDCCGDSTKEQDEVKVMCKKYTASAH